MGVAYGVPMCGSEMFVGMKSAFDIDFSLNNFVSA